MRRIAENLWIMEYPLSLLGGHQGRVVTVIRLTSGKLIIHSTGPFGSDDVARIRALGEPAWLVDAMLRHDTFAKDGRAAFQGIPYLAPESFSKSAGVETQPLLPTLAEWHPEVQVAMVAGMPDVLEHVFLHVPSRTLVVADLVFNFLPAKGWTSFMRRTLMGVKESPDSARLYPLLVKDRLSYELSMAKILAWDFDRIIVGHNEPVESNGKERLKRALANKGMLPR